MLPPIEGCVERWMYIWWRAHCDLSAHAEFFQLLQFFKVLQYGCYVTQYDGKVALLEMSWHRVRPFRSCVPQV
jgi:hypothetical protein